MILACPRLYDRVDSGPVLGYNRLSAMVEVEMDCPNCGVYNPDERTVCWRCNQELPKPKEPKKKRGDPATMQRRMWILVGIVLVIWVLLTWLIPLLLGGGGGTPP